MCALLFLPGTVANAARTLCRAQGCFLLHYGPSPIQGNVYLLSRKCRHLLRGNTKYLFAGGLSSYLFSLFLGVGATSSRNRCFPENLDKAWDLLCHFGFDLCTHGFIVNSLKRIPEGKQNNEASASKMVPLKLKPRTKIQPHQQIFAPQGALSKAGSLRRHFLRHLLLAGKGNH